MGGQELWSPPACTVVVDLDITDNEIVGRATPLTQADADALQWPGSIMRPLSPELKKLRGFASIIEQGATQTELEECGQELGKVLAECFEVPTLPASRDSIERLSLVRLIDELAEGGGLRMGLSLHHRDLRRLPWEAALLEWDRPPIGVWPGLSVVRGPSLRPQRRAADDRHSRFLYLAACRVLPDQEISFLKERDLIRAALPSEWMLIDEQEPTILTRKLLGEIAQKEPRVDVVHLLSHATPEGVVLYGSGNAAGGDAVSLADLAKILEPLDPLVVVLQSCWSGSEADGLSRGRPPAYELLRGRTAAVISMRTAITNKTAVDFSGAFYDKLGQGATVDQAMVAGRAALKDAEKSIPLLYAAANETIVLTDPPTPPTPSPDDRIETEVVASLQAELTFVPPRSVGLPVTGPWVAVDLAGARRVHLIEARGPVLSMRSLKSGHEWEALTLDFEVGNLVLTPDGRSLIAAGEAVLGVIDVDDADLVRPWPPLTLTEGSKVLAARRVGDAVEVFTATADGSEVLRFYKGGEPETTKLPGNALVAAATARGFVQLGADGPIQAGEELELPLDRGITWRDVDVATRSRRPLAVGVGLRGATSVLWAISEGKASLVEVEGGTERVHIARAESKGPATILTQHGDRVVMREWGDLAPDEGA